MSRKKRLSEYRSRRDFRRTGEPSGKDQAGDSSRPLFVIQEHRASTRHFDFRLEADGVLKSWAVPKGPSTDPRQKRLAVPTEDHPLDYAGFEGVIPEEEYGGGAVIVWDRGPYRNLREKDGEEIPVAQCVEDGHVTVWLEGQKLTGGYALVRTGKKSSDARWLLVKMDDAGADARRNPVSTEPGSVLSGVTVGELAEREKSGDS